MAQLKFVKLLAVFVSSAGLLVVIGWIWKKKSNRALNFLTVPTPHI